VCVLFLTQQMVSIIIIIVDGKRYSPKAEHKVDIPSRHLVTTEKEVSDFKLEAIIKWCPVIRSSI